MDADGRRAALAALLDEVVSGLERTAVAIDAAHFTHLEPRRVLAGSIQVPDDADDVGGVPA